MPLSVFSTLSSHYFPWYKVFIQIEKEQEREGTFAGHSLHARWEIFMIIIGILTSILKFILIPYKIISAGKNIRHNYYYHFAFEIIDYTLFI